MRALIQRVGRAKVEVEGDIIGEIGKGYLVFLGVGDGDTEMQAQRLWDKIFKMRIFSDSEGKTNLALSDVGGEVLVISQFTLFANCKKGNRPSFAQAGKPDEAERLYGYFVESAKQDVEKVETGSFGADMKVSLENDGPFTIWLDTEDL